MVIRPPDTEYALAGDAHIGYEQWFSNVDALWDIAPLRVSSRRMTRAKREPL